MSGLRVSFVVVTYARRELVARAIALIRRQTIDSREIVAVVNDRYSEGNCFAHSALRCAPKCLRTSLASARGGMPQSWRERRPISHRTRQLLARNGGRLWSERPSTEGRIIRGALVAQATLRGCDTRRSN